MGLILFDYFDYLVLPVLLVYFRFLLCEFCLILLWLCGFVVCILVVCLGFLGVWDFVCFVVSWFVSLRLVVVFALLYLVYVCF